MCVGMCVCVKCKRLSFKKYISLNSRTMHMVHTNTTYAIAKCVCYPSIVLL